MKNTILIIVAIVVVVLVVVAAFVYFGNSAAPAPASTENGNASTSTATATSSGGVPASQALPGAPKESTLTIGTSQGSVVVKNFYLSNPKVDYDGNVLVAETQNYFISYDTSDSSFWIAITSEPFNTWRALAEADFISILGITQRDACKLSVSEGIPYDATNALSGKSFPLSFCPITPSL